MKTALDYAKKITEIQHRYQIKGELEQELELVIEKKQSEDSFLKQVNEDLSATQVSGLIIALIGEIEKKVAINTAAIVTQLSHSKVLDNKASTEDNKERFFRTLKYFTGKKDLKKSFEQIWKILEPSVKLMETEEGKLDLMNATSSAQIFYNVFSLIKSNDIINSMEVVSNLLQTRTIVSSNSLEQNKESFFKAAGFFVNDENTEEVNKEVIDLSEKLWDLIEKPLSVQIEATTRNVQIALECHEDFAAKRGKKREKQLAKRKKK